MYFIFPSVLFTLVAFGLLPPAESQNYEAIDWRLTGGATPNEGRLEVRIQETDPSVWHTVCADSFADDLPPLLCVTLGFPYTALPCSKQIPPTTELPNTDLGQILAMSAICPISGKTLEDCILLDLTDATSGICTHDNDVWISCFSDFSDIEVRLVDGLYPGDGYVQTRCPNSTWSTVCSGLWDPRDANTVCKQLGFPYAYGIDPEGTLSTDLGEVVVNNVYCTGEETTFGECRLENNDAECFRGAPGVQCSEYYDAGGIALPICGQHHCADPLSTNPFSNPQDYCKCDCTCLFIGDCCLDFDASVFCPLEVPSDHTINGLSIEFYDCIGVPGSERNNYGLVLVSKCPDEWTDINTRLNCEIERDTSDVVGLIPVHDSDKVVYKNIFCASCHGKSIEDVTFWSVEVLSLRGGPGYIDPDLGIFHPGIGFVGYVVQWPDESVRPRSCLFDFIDSCPSDFQDERIASACQSYHAPIYFSQYLYSEYPKPYKNLHCALCNGVLEDHFRAACDGQCDPITCSADAPEEPCDGSRCRNMNFLTVEALFSFNELQKDTYGVPNSCPGDDVYDPFLKQCRSLSCPPDFVLVDNMCKPMNPPDPKITEADVIGTEFSKNTLACLLDVTGLISSSNTGAKQIVTTEHRQETRTCVAEDIGCEIEEISTAMLTFLFQKDTDLIKYVDSVDPTLANHTNMSVCNITNIEVLISFSDTYALPSHCEGSLNNSRELFNGTESSQQILTYASYSFDATYSSTFASRSCLINTELNCSVTVSLNQSEYTMMTSSNNNSIHVIASNASIQREGYLLLADGTVLICSTSEVSPPSPSTRSAVEITAYVCSWLSVIALIATLFTYLMFKSLRNIAGKAVMNLVIALLLAYLGLQLQGYLLINAGACTAWAILTHFFWIGAFTWMMMFAFNIARTFARRGVVARRNSDGGSFLKYFCIGWAIPTIIIGVSIGLHFCNCTSITFHYGNIEENLCFLRSSMAVLYAFVVPISILLFLSIVFFIFMAIQLRRKRSDSKFARKGGAVEEISFEAVIYLRLSGVIGVTWIFAYLYFLIPDSIVVSYIYNILNSLQGVFIFLAFGFTSRVRGMWKEKFHEITSSTKSTGTSKGRSMPLKNAASSEVLNESAGHDSHASNTAL